MSKLKYAVVLTPIFLVSAQLFEMLWWAVVPAVFLLFFVASHIQSPRKMFLIGWGIGSANALAAIAWFWSVYPLDWLGLTGLSQLSIIGIYWLITGVIIGLGFGVVFGCYHWLGLPSWTLPIWLLAGESLGALFFSIYALGPGGYVNMNFSFGWLGYLVIDLPLVQDLAGVSGVYALSASVYLLGFLLWWMYRHSHSLFPYMMTVLFVALLIINTTLQQYAKGDETVLPKIIAIDTYFDPAKLLKPDGWLERELVTKSAVAKALAFTPDVIVLPEDARFSSSFPNSQAALEYFSSQTQSPVTLIDSARTTTLSGEVIIRAFIFNTKTQSVLTVDKQYLVPQGEYLSYFYKPLLKLYSSPDLYEKLVADVSYVPGPHTSYKGEANDVPNVLFCMESISPLGAKKLQTQHPGQYIVHLVSHGWFNEPKQLWWKLDRMLRVHARWAKVPIMSAGNGSDGRYYNSHGDRLKGKTIHEGSLYKLVMYSIEEN